MKTYDDYPVVQVANALQKEDWFVLGGGRITFDCSKQNFAPQYANCTPTLIVATMNYSNSIIEFEIRNTNDGKPFRIRATEPSFILRMKPSRPNTVRKALSKIRDIAITLTEEIDKYEEVHAEEIKQEARRKEVISNVIKAFNANINQEKAWQETALTFRMSRNYSLTFHPDEQGLLSDVPVEKLTFIATELRGIFSYEDIKQLIEFLTTHPQAAADRLIHGKRE